MQRPDEPKPAADLPRHVCCWCNWDSMWPEAGGGCYMCLRERLKRGHAPGAAVVEDDDGAADGPEVP
jgi:hypothetical protein